MAEEEGFDKLAADLDAFSERWEKKASAYGWERYSGEYKGPAFKRDPNAPFTVTQWHDMPLPPLWQRLRDAIWPKKRHLYVTFNFKPDGPETFWHNAEAWVEMPPGTDRFYMTIQCWQDGQIAFDGMPKAIISGGSVRLP